jgi:nucleotide-binding universal stress UspA family protein
MKTKVHSNIANQGATVTETREPSRGTSKKPFVPGIKNILAAIDFSDLSEEALRYGALLAEKFDSIVTPLHVVEPIDHFGLSAEFGLEGKALAEAMRCRLDNLLCRDVDVDRRGDATLRDGRPYKEIIAAAGSLHSDLIVIGCRGAALDYIFLGGTAEHVIRRAPCPVVVVRRPPDAALRLHKILVPVDFSPASVAAARYALGFSQVVGARVTVMKVVPQLPLSWRMGANVGGLERKLRQIAEFDLESLHALLEVPKDAFDILLEQGVPYHQIIEAA